MGKGKSIAGLVLGCVSLFCQIIGYVIPFASFLALPLAIVGLVLSVSAGKKAKANGQKSGIATAGLIVGIIATVLSGIGFVCAICAVCVIAAAAASGV